MTNSEHSQQPTHTTAGGLDHDFYARRARRLRSAYVAGLWRAIRRQLRGVREFFQAQPSSDAALRRAAGMRMGHGESC